MYKNKTEQFFFNTAWGGFKDVVQEGETGYFVDAVLTKNGIRVDWARGTRAVVTLLQQRELREEMGQRAASYFSSRRVKVDISV